MMNLTRTLTLLLGLALTATGCSGKDGDTGGGTTDGGTTDGGTTDGGTTDGGTDGGTTDGGTDGGTTDGGTTDGGTDGGDSGDTGDTGAVTGYTLTVPSKSLTTREQAVFTLEVDYEDGSSADVTADATWGVDDESLMKFYTPGVGQPLDGGEVTVSVSYGGEVDAEVPLAITVSPAGVDDLVINEILVDATVEGDPNGDGVTDSVEDEFIELANRSDVTVDLSGVTVVETDYLFVPRHTFAEGTALRAGEAIVVFGGGDAKLTADNARFLVADNDDPGLSFGLNLSDSGDVVTVYAADGETVITELAYGDDGDGSVPATSDASVTLNVDIDGSSYIDHSGLTGGDFSPGSFQDGAAFPGPDGRY